MTAQDRSDPADTRIRPLGDLRTHHRLALQMSRTVGLDLVAETAAGRLDQAGWADMVTRCRGCEWAECCPSWMAAQEAPVAPPARCANAGRFDALRAAASVPEEEP